jgi:hypothetical protein
VEQQLQTLMVTVKGIKDSLAALSEMQNIVARLSNIESLLERVAKSNEGVVLSNEKLAALMEKAWHNYDQLKDQETITTITTKTDT